MQGRRGVRNHCSLRSALCSQDSCWLLVPKSQKIQDFPISCVGRGEHSTWAGQNNPSRIIRARESGKGTCECGWKSFPLLPLPLPLLFVASPPFSLLCALLLSVQLLPWSLLSVSSDPGAWGDRHLGHPCDCYLWFLKRTTAFMCFSFRVAFSAYFGRSSAEFSLYSFQKLEINFV